MSERQGKRGNKIRLSPKNARRQNENFVGFFGTFEKVIF